MRVGRLLRAALICTAVLVGAPGTLAQSVSASISGRVSTPEGVGVPDAAISLIALDTGASRAAVSGADGAWRVASMTPGRYQVVARAPDGNASSPVEVEVALQQSLELDLVVMTGLQEEVTVRGEAPLIDPQRSWSELRIDATQTESLPVDGRAITDLALLDSSIVQAAEGNFYGERANVFVVGGQSGRANSFLVDGLDNGDRVSSTTLNSFFSQQVIDELVVMTRQFDAEFGRASGGVLNILTRRGANQRTGSAFYQGTSSSWNSPGDFVAGLPASADETSVGRVAAGISVGGPIRRDESFYFAAYEHQRADDVIAYSGAGRDGRDGGVLVAPADSDSLFVRTDFALGERSDLMLRASYDKRFADGVNVSGLLTPEAGFELAEQDLQLAASLKTVLSPNLINEVRLLVGRSDFDQRARSERPGVDRPSGIFGGNDLARQSRDERRYQLVENLTWLRGDHTFKAGLDVLHTRTSIATRFNPNGGFLYRTDETFDPGDCGDVFASQVAAARLIEEEQGLRVPIDCPGQVGIDDDGDGTVDEPALWWTYPLVFRLIDGNPSALLEDTQVALFVQDSWRPSRRFTLSYGLRYDVSSFRLPESARIASELVPNGGAGRDSDNLAPRLAFTMRPYGDARLVFRGGAGVFYDKIPLAFPALSDVTSGTRIGLIFPQPLGFEITEDVVEEFGIDALREVLIFPERLTLRFSTGTELETPYVVQYGLGGDMALSRTQIVSLDFERALGYHQVLLRDLNPVVGEDPLGIPIHRDPDLGSIAAIVTEGRSWYWGATASWRWRTDESWISASYTVSRAEDLGPDPLKAGVSLPPDSDDLGAERARSDSDRRHRVVLAGGVPLPGGFKGSLVVQYASEVPFNVVTGIDENLDGFVNERPQGVGRNSGETTPLDVVNALRAREGLPDVAELAEPEFLQVDARLVRPFSLAERYDGEIFVQVFNVFDRFNAGAIEGRVISRNFGGPLGVGGPPRTVELGLKIGF